MCGCLFDGDMTMTQTVMGEQWIGDEHGVSNAFSRDEFSSLPVSVAMLAVLAQHVAVVCSVVLFGLDCELHVDCFACAHPSLVCS